MLYLLLLDIIQIANGSITTAIVNNTKPFLDIAALVLGLVNGWYLLRHYSKDKPILVVEPVHIDQDIYQCYFNLPDIEDNGKIYKRYGFLIYFSVKNKGLRNVAMNSRRLFVKNKMNKEIELMSRTISNPQITLNHGAKVFNVFGLKGEGYDGETMVVSGGSIQGFAYYAYYFEDINKDVPIINIDPSTKRNVINAKLVVTDAFGTKVKADIVFYEIPLEKAKEMVADIEKVL